MFLGELFIGTLSYLGLKTQEVLVPPCLRHEAPQFKVLWYEPAGHPGFSDGGRGRQPVSLGQKLLFDKVFAKNCMKMKESGPRGGIPRAGPLDPPMRTVFLDE